MKIGNVWYERTTPLIKTLRIPGATPEARKRKFYSLCAALGLRKLGKREGAGEWLFPVVEVRKRIRAYEAAQRAANKKGRSR